MMPKNHDAHARAHTNDGSSSTWLQAALGAGLALVQLGCGVPTTDSASSDVTQAPLAAEYTLLQRDLHAEGLAFDAVTRSFFASSVAHGSVTRVAPNGDEQVVFEGNDPTLGMEADSLHRNLWVCSIVDNDQKSGTVHQIDLDTLALVNSYMLEEIYEAASCNDVTVDSDGVAYVTDRENPHIYRIDPATQTASLWLSHEELEPAMVGMNGIAIDGDHMIVTKYLPPRLYSIPLTNPGALRRIDLDGDWLHVAFHPLSGADGLELLDGDLYLAFDHGAFRLQASDAGWSEAEVERLDDVDPHGGLTAIVAAEGALYGSNGQPLKYVLGIEPDAALIWRLNASTAEKNR